MNTRVLVVTALLSFLCAPSEALQSASPPPDDSLSQETSVGMLLAQAHQLALSGSDSRRALALYAEALSLDDANAEILWMISRSYVDLGEHLTVVTDEDKELQLSMYEKALEFASKSVQANPSSSMAYAQRAIALAHVAPFKGFWESVGFLKDVRNDLDRALQLDSSNDLAHFTLGTTHLKVIDRPWIIRWPLGLGWGSREEALRHFEAAVALRWDVIRYRLAAARYYLDEENLEPARAHLTLIPYLQPLSPDDVLRRTEALRLLQSLEKNDD